MSKQAWWVVRKSGGEIEAVAVAPVSPDTDYALVMAESADKAAEVARWHMDTFLPGGGK